MNGNDVIEKVQTTAELLYQNREQEGISAVSELITQFQNILQDLSEEQMNMAGSFGVLMLKELLDAYQSRNMLAMADCLMEKSILFIQFIYQEN